MERSPQSRRRIRQAVSLSGRKDHQPRHQLLRDGLLNRLSRWAGRRLVRFG